MREAGREAFGLPVLVEFYDDLAVEHAVNLRLGGDGDFFGALGGVERDFALAEQVRSTETRMVTRTDLADAPFTPDFKKGQK